MFFGIKTKKYFAFFLLLFIVVGLSIPFTSQAIDKDTPIVGDFLSTVKAGYDCVTKPEYCVANILSLFVEALIWVLGILLGLAGAILDNVLKFTDFKTPGVVAGWEALRDLVNMLFILVLLVVAFATILNIQKYSVKEILPRLIIVALLINFSLPIVFVVVDAAQILMFAIYNAIVGGLSGDCSGGSPGVCLSNLAMVKNLLVDGTNNTPVTTGDAWTRFGNLVLAAIFLFVFVVVVGAGSILLVVRIVGIWIAAIFSPLAFFSYILPSSQKFANTWLTKFLQYTFFGPIYIFFLWLSLVLLQYVPTFLQGQGLKDYITFTEAPVSDFVKYLGNVLQFIMVIVLLLWSFLATRQLGIKYGEKIAGKAEKFMTGTAKSAGWMVDRWAARGAPILPFNIRGRQVGLSPLRYLSYGAQKRAWDNRRKRAETVYNKASGAIEDRIEMVSHPFTALNDLRKGKNPRRRYYYEQLRHQAEVSDRENKIASSVKDEDQLVSIAQGANDPVEREAALRRMAATNSLNTFFARQGKTFNAENFVKFLKSGGFGSADEQARLAADIKAIAEGSGNYSLAGITTWDGGKIKIVDNVKVEHEKAVVSRIDQSDPQELMRKIHPDALFKYDAKGKAIDLSDTGKIIIKNLDTAQIKQMDRMQPRNLKRLKEVEDATGAVTAANIEVKIKLDTL